MKTFPNSISNLLFLSFTLSFFACQNVKVDSVSANAADTIHESDVSIDEAGCTEIAQDTMPQSAALDIEGQDDMPITDKDFVVLAEVVPDIIQEIRYYTTYNFVGRHIPGYDEPVALMTKRAADSLLSVSNDVVAQGYRLKVFDAYRPMRAVRYFVQWGSQLNDTLMKRYFYPEVNKADVFRLGYLSSRSAHSRGSTIDLTLFDMKTEREVDMGGTYDFFGDVSHPNYTRGLTAEQIRHRKILREAMMRHGFKPVSTEWWHYTLINEPCPGRFFDYPNSVNSARRK